LLLAVLLHFPLAALTLLLLLPVLLLEKLDSLLSLLALLFPRPLEVFSFHLLFILRVLCLLRRMFYGLLLPSLRRLQYSRDWCLLFQLLSSPKLFLWILVAVQLGFRSLSARGSTYTWCSTYTRGRLRSKRRNL
jgi:hypothetical protein